MPTDHRLGVQSVVYGENTLLDVLDEFRAAPVDALELWAGHVAADDGEDVLTAAEGILSQAAVTVVGYGVVDIAAVGDVRPHAALAARLGADYLTVNYPPDRDDVTEELCAIAGEFDLDVAIHNYSTVHHGDLDAVFSSIDDVASVLDRFDDPRLGACVDTGHFLAMDEEPEAALDRLAGRVHAVHLKDTSDEAIEDLPGAGELDLDAVVELLAEGDALDVPLVVEYELEPERATEALEEAIGNVRGALDRKA